MGDVPDQNFALAIKACGSTCSQGLLLKIFCLQKEMECNVWLLATFKQKCGNHYQSTQYLL